LDLENKVNRVWMTFVRVSE